MTTQFSIYRAGMERNSLIYLILRGIIIYVYSQFSLKEVIRQTIFSIAPNDSNKMMTGELFQVTGEPAESGFSGWSQDLHPKY